MKVTQLLVICDYNSDPDPQPFILISSDIKIFVITPWSYICRRIKCLNLLKNEI